MNAYDKLMLAAYVRQQTKQAGALKTLGSIADTGSYFIPGVGTARMGYDAFKDFRSGNYLGGAANLLGAGLSLIPGAGGFAGKGVSALGRIGAKALTRVGAPTLSKAVAAGGGLAGRGLSALGTAVDRGVSRAGTGMTRAVGQMPRIGGITSKTMSGVGNFAKTRPGTTAVLGTGGVMGLGAAGAGQMEAKAQQQAQGAGMGQMLQNMRRSPVMTNPMFAGGGRNAQIGF